MADATPVPPPAPVPALALVMPPFCTRHLGRLCAAIGGTHSLELHVRVHVRVCELVVQVVLDAHGLGPWPVDVTPPEWEICQVASVLAARAPLCCRVGDERFQRLGMVAILEQRTVRPCRR